jgi:hypothetical protein
MISHIRLLFLAGLLGILPILNIAYAQFAVSGQLRTRFKLRQGKGTLPEVPDKICIFQNIIVIFYDIC